MALRRSADFQQSDCKYGKKTLPHSKIILPLGGKTLPHPKIILPLDGKTLPHSKTILPLGGKILDSFNYISRYFLKNHFF
jgi:hypothetical protein